MSDIGKHFVVGLSSTALNPEEIQQIKELQPLGFIFFNRNFESSENWLVKFKDLQQQIRRCW